MVRFRWIAPILALGVASGCATMFRGTRQTIHVESIPAAAQLHHRGTGETWVTPVDVSLPRKNRHALFVTKDGYQSQEIYLRSEVPFQWWFIDAFTLGIGTGIDAILGGLYDLKPERVTVVLERDPANTSQQP